MRKLATRTIINALAISIICLTLINTHAQAQFVLKEGEVLSSDGNVYKGASPRIRQHLIDKAQEDGDITGINNNSVFVIVDDVISFVPVSSISGLDDEKMLDVIGNQVIQDVTGIDTITYQQFQEAREVSEELGVPISELAVSAKASSLSPDILQELETIAEQSGIEISNLTSLYENLGGLEQAQFDAVTESIEEMIESGFADEVNQTLSQLAEQGLLKEALEYNSYEDCQNQGGSNCDAINDIIGDGPDA